MVPTAAPVTAIVSTWRHYSRADGHPTLRKPGVGKRRVWIARDFDATLPPEVLRLFGIDRSGGHRSMWRHCVSLRRLAEHLWIRPGLSSSRQRSIDRPPRGPDA